MAESKSPSGKAAGHCADITVEDECQKVVEFALELFGRLDILVNNVGINGAPGTAVYVDMKAWAVGMEVNVASMVLMTKFSVPAMGKNTGRLKGSIVNMGSVTGLKGGTHHLLYPASKGAVVNMTRFIAAHHAPDRMLYTPMMYSTGMSEKAREARRNRSLLGTEGTTWDAACATVFLASDQARWITGVVLPVDAGVTAAVGIGLPKTASVDGTQTP